MNKLGFGFLRLKKLDGGGENDFDWNAINEQVDEFMSRGGYYFDTAYTYLNGFSEYGIRECVVKRKPRGSVQICDKLPGYKCKSREDCGRFFEEQLERCGVDYFDVYMLHWLNARNYEKAERYGEFEFLRELKEKGLARRIGFSYHDSASLLDEILTAHPEVDLVQIQLNYLDWETAGIESRKCYETIVKHGKKVYVMEPVKGGSLASLPGEAEALLRAAHPDWSPAAWALRFVQSLPEVEICLSGMNDIAQVRENMEQFEPLTEDDVALLAKVRGIIERNTKVPCTGCRYCVSHCPMGIQIPDIFKMLNELHRWPAESWKIQPSYAQLTKNGGTASSCVKCGSCAQNCPQHIAIPDFIAEAAASFEK
ncbi:MAG: aldo/keto reductase [Firmicutes bacterium]|nr:aldo/keto reductase [Bacillota bacterium]